MKISEGQKYIDAAGRKVEITGRGKINNGQLWIYYGFQIDRKGARLGGERLWKSDGRDAVGDMTGNIVREAAVGMSIGEEEAIILERLIEACETDRALPVSIGPRMYGNTLSSTTMSSADVYALEVYELINGQKGHTRDRNAAINAADVRKALCSPKRISRMEEAFGWLGRYIIDDDLRKATIAYATVKAEGGDWSRYIEQRNRRYTQQKAWVKRTIYRWIEKTLQIVAMKVRNDGIILRDGAGLQMAHQEAEQPCKSISSVLRVRREDDLNRPEPMSTPANAA